MGGGENERGSGTDVAFWVRCETDARRSPDPAARVEAYFLYLEAFPTGAHNRRAAEAIEDLLLEVRDPVSRDRMGDRLREIRERYMPPVEPNSWDGSLES